MRGFINLFSVHTSTMLPGDFEFVRIEHFAELPELVLLRFLVVIRV
jgi:hypothetical protein